jgi:hypothetical protein
LFLNGSLIKDLENDIIAHVRGVDANRLASATRRERNSTWLLGFTSLIFVYLIAGGSHDGIDGEAEFFH